MNTRHFALLFVGLIVGLAASAGWRHLEREDPVSTAPHGREHQEVMEGPHDADHDDHELPVVEDGHADEHDGHDHAAQDGHKEHDAIHLSDEARVKFDIELAVAEPGSLGRDIERPGEVVLNDGRVAHIVPQAPGIVREVVKNVGDPVEAGEVLAWVESAELGQAKADYLAKWAEVGCCTLDLTRAQQIHENTLKLLEILETSPSLETLQQVEQAATGDYGRMLVSAYAEFELARAAYQRERELLDKGVSSEKDYQVAEGAYKKGAAEYAATRDGAEFDVRRALLEAKRMQQVRQIELKSAERRLYVLGLHAEEIRSLEQLAQTETSGSSTQPACNDPNCKDCKAGAHAQEDRHNGADATKEDDEKLAWYALRAPFAGTVIQKHITLGERLGYDANPFTIADLSSVWVDICVYQSDLPHVRRAQKVAISAGSGTPDAEGTIAFVAPVIGEDTRTTCARVVLPNPDGRWMPGLYVTARISVDRHDVAVLIPKEAIQTIEDQSVVFVPTDDGFEPRPVNVDRSSATHAEIVAGLSPGDRYVLGGAFALKAEIVTSGLGSHAGHGH